MPDLSPEILLDIRTRLGSYLKTKKGYDSPEYLACGGSAATYSVSTPSGKRAIKVYDPKFLEGTAAKAEKRRLELQRNLIGHKCAQLVSVFGVDEAESTAFIEMEFIGWPRLKDVLAQVPDDRVSLLIQKLVGAVVYLEAQDIVHRDIKPENIHVAPDFDDIKLLDLGVARGIDVHEDDSGEGTDQGSTRPFIATAQYSSPEYLFRLDEPSVALWKGLNIYQVGAVLHDLINKRPIFQDEVDKKNRWLVARSVLEKPPSFPDADPARLARQKALAARCLAKDGIVRMQIASWTDFDFEAPADGLATLHAKLAKDGISAGAQSLNAAKLRLEFERVSFAKRMCDGVKSELISACNQKIGLSMYPDGASPYAFVFDFIIKDAATMRLNISLAWNSGLYAKTATVLVSASLATGGKPHVQKDKRPISTASIGSNEDVSTTDVAQTAAVMLAHAIDLIEVTSDEDTIHGWDVASTYNAKE